MRSTFSAFYYGIEITGSNRYLCFDEGNGELVASLRPGRYTPTTLMNEAARAMNEVAVDGIYTGLLDRANRLITIEADIPFDLLVATGSTTASCFSTLGFNGLDLTGEDSYRGDSAVGFSYVPQFKLQSWVYFDDYQKAVESTLNQSASGEVELIRFGRFKLMEAEIKFITDIDQGVGSPIRTDLSGVDNLRHFMENATDKGPIEFMPDMTQPGTYRNCILESTAESQQGVDFKLKEMFAQNLPGYFTTGLLTFREVSL